jgi:predicted NUDIX family NTP pyrophosphohydrolase
MPKQSAGVLLYRKLNDVLQVLLVHPGGPFWKNKDEGAWSIPKGEYEDDEDALDAAKREFYEETGQYIDGEFIALNPIKLKSGKTVQAWAVEGDIDHHQIKSNLFEMEWPPKSGKMQAFAEVDRGDWFTIEQAKVKINPAQVALVEELAVSISF